MKASATITIFIIKIIMAHKVVVILKRKGIKIVVNYLPRQWLPFSILYVNTSIILSFFFRLPFASFTPILAGPMDVGGFYANFAFLCGNVVHL